MGIIIQKYGGTSLRDIHSQKNVLTHIKECIKKGNNLVIVVSAIGRRGEPYATDTLIEQLEKISSDVDPKKKDLIMSCGEVISAAIVAHLLDSEGITSEALMGFQAGIVTDNNFNSSRIIDIDTSVIKNYIKEGKVVVVAGFQGATKDFEITTLGRGGSDTTAVTLGGFLNSERVDIFTDVPGVAIIDPHIVPSTKFIKNISYKEMYKLAINGVGVVHPSAILAGERFNIPIHVRSTYSNLSGTLISSDGDKDSILLGMSLKVQQELGEISVFFKNIENKNIVKDLELYLVDYDEGFLGITFYEDRISFMVKSEKTNEYAKIIYQYVFDNYM